MASNLGVLASHTDANPTLTHLWSAACGLGGLGPPREPAWRRAEGTWGDLASPGTLSRRSRPWGLNREFSYQVPSRYATGHGFGGGSSRVAPSPGDRARIA